MTRHLTPLCAWLGAMAYFVAAGSAQAQLSNFVSYVSAVNGSDANGCGPGFPCATIAFAYTHTVPYGEIVCMGSGNYGVGFEITQSVTIDCDGGAGSTFGGIVINGANIVVKLRNLTLDSQGQGSYGIDAQNMAALYVENCVIKNFNAGQEAATPYIGIKFQPSSNAELFVSSSVISNNGDSSSPLSGGIYIVPSAGITAKVSVDHSQITGNRFGIVGDGRSGGTIRATISDSVVSGNTEDGIVATSSGTDAWFVVDQTKVSGNFYGLATSGSGAGIAARNTTVFNNATGLFTQNNGALATYGNNSVTGNTTNGSFTNTLALQ